MARTAADNVVIRNILYMIAYASGVSGSDANSLFNNELESVGAETVNGLEEIFSLLLTKEVKRQHLRGFEHAYVQREELLATLRGRPLIQQCYAQRARGSLRLLCSYEDRTIDTYMNRVIRTSIEHLIRRRGLSDSSLKELRACILYLDKVEPLGADRIDWRRVNYNGLNRSYRFLMAVCHMILENKVPFPDGVDKALLPSLLSAQRLSSLFENFLREYYRKHYPQLKPRAAYVDHGIGLQSEHLPRLKTDIVLTGPSTQLIIDAKCYGTILQTNCGHDIFSPEHRNQILSYVLHTSRKDGSAMGMLLYAQTRQDDQLNEFWHELGHWFNVRTIDLGLPFELISKQLDDIGDALSKGTRLAPDYYDEALILKAE